VKVRILLPLLACLILQAACNLPTRSTDTASAEFAEPVVTLTETPALVLPTVPPATPEPLPSATPLEPTPTFVDPCAGEQTDSFDTPGGCWDGDSLYSVTENHHPDSVSVGIRDGMLVFDLEANEELYLYRLKEETTFSDVIVRASIINLVRGTNKNGAILACRVNRSGWYEVRIESGGYFHAYRFDRQREAQEINPYIFLAEGGTTALRVGHGRSNQVEWQCVGDRLVLLVNGQTVWERDILEAEPGGVGIGVTSFANYHPVVLGFDEVRAFKP
jgi:hypothetical protein